MAMIARCFVLVSSAFLVTAAPSDFAGISVEETQVCNYCIVMRTCHSMN